MTTLSVAIAGGGVGGLTAAIALAMQGYHVDVFEQSSTFGEIGAGVQLSPNSTRVLRYLGLDHALLKYAFIPHGTEFRHWRDGNIISDSPLGGAAVERFGAPYYHIHRGDLLRVLIEATSQFSNIKLHTNTRITNFSQNDDGVSVVVNDKTHTADVLVGADGIHSMVRSELWGAETPRFTGNVAWRALVPTEKLPPNLVRPMSTVWWGPGKHFVHYYVRGGEMVNCVCVVEKEGWENESWTSPGEHAELLSDFSGWHVDLQSLIHHVDQESLFKWALFDRTPMQAWGTGRVTLLGDACHATLPFMAQGAAMAIEDAIVLTGCLSHGTDIASSLQEYEVLRRERTARIQNGSRRNASVFHLAGIKAWLRNRAVRAAGNRTMDQLYSYDAVSVAGYAENVGNSIDH